jgi:hypothetical protein
MNKQTLLTVLNDRMQWTATNKSDLQTILEQYPYFDAVATVLHETGATQSPWPSNPFDAARQRHWHARSLNMVTDEPQEKEPANITATHTIEEAVIIETSTEPLEQNPPTNDEDILQLINKIPLHSEINLDTLPTVAPAPEAPKEPEADVRDKSLMVMMSFTDWLNYYKVKQLKEKEEAESKKALNASWQKEKLAAAVEEDVEDEVPETIFKQAMDSISTETGIISESLAKLLAEQGKTDRAIAMYKKLSLRNPEKSSYFARLIDQLSSKTH